MSMLPWQQKQWAQVTTAAGSDRLPHALSLTGPEGIGLTEFALQVAGSLLCQNAGVDSMPCGQCRACVLMRAGNHPDILRVSPEEPGKQIRVDEIRALLEFMHLSSHSGRYKVAIIDPADAMNRTAANTLLKILEEPPSGAVMMLCCRQPGRLPITIRSRCQQLAFNGDCGAATQQWLAQRFVIGQGNKFIQGTHHIVAVGPVVGSRGRHLVLAVWTVNPGRIGWFRRAFYRNPPPDRKWAA